MNNTTVVLTAKRLFDGSRVIDDPVVLVEDGRIASIETRASGAVPVGTRVFDFPGATLAPSFFDIHIHGAAGHDVMEATPEALSAVEKFLASRGRGTFSGDDGDRPAGYDASRGGWSGKADGAAKDQWVCTVAGDSSGGAVSFARTAGRAAGRVLARAEHRDVRQVSRRGSGVCAADDLPGTRGCGGIDCACHPTRGSSFTRPFKCESSGNAGRDCSRGGERDAYLQRHAATGSSRAGYSGHSAYQ